MIVSLLDEIEKERRQTGEFCSVRKMLDSLGPEDRAEWVEALAGGHQHAALGRVARRRNFDVSDGSMGRHRTGSCKCSRVTS